MPPCRVVCLPRLARSRLLFSPDYRRAALKVFRIFIFILPYFLEMLGHFVVTCLLSLLSEVSTHRLPFVGLALYSVLRLLASEPTIPAAAAILIFICFSLRQTDNLCEKARRTLTKVARSE
jgi:hypothetical protein